MKLREETKKQNESIEKAIKIIEKKDKVIDSYALQSCDLTGTLLKYNEVQDKCEEAEENLAAVQKIYQRP